MSKYYLHNLAFNIKCLLKIYINEQSIFSLFLIEVGIKN